MRCRLALLECPVASLRDCGSPGLSVSMQRLVSIAHGHDLLHALARLSCFAPLARPQELRFDR
jgi:hypothetical protein